MILEEGRRPTAGGERTKAISVLHLPHFTGKNLDLGSPERTPSHERRAARSAAIKTMAIAQLLRCLKRSIAHAAAQTTSFDRRLHPASTRSRLLEPFGNEMRARVDIGLAKRTVARIDEAVIAGFELVRHSLEREVLLTDNVHYENAFTSRRP